MRWSHVLAAAAGFAAVGGYAPFGLFPLPLLSLALLFRLWAASARPLAGFALGLSWGLGFFLGGISWLYVALNRFGGMPPPLAGLAIFLFCAFLALYPALAGALWVRLRRGRPWRDALLAAGLWTLAELARGTLLTGFPWLAVGYSQTPPSPLAGFAPLVGVFGVGFVAVLAAALLAFVPWGRRAQAALATVVLLAIGGAGLALREQQWTTAHGNLLQVSLIQTDIEQSAKWRPEFLQRWLKVNLDLVREHPARLVVLPETTLPLLAEQIPGDYIATLADAVEGVGADLIFGVFVRDADGSIHNAALSLGAAGGQRYAKNHLVPFGEYSPPLFGWFYEWASIPMSDQSPGGSGQPPMTLAGQRVGINICYEDLFGAEIARAATHATLLLNLSNLAWYGDSLAQPQHLQIARMRALETGRTMLRSTNTGMTAVVEPDGRVAALLPAFQRGALRVEVQGRQGLTPYMRWQDKGALLLAVLACAGGLVGRRRVSDQA